MARKRILVACGTAIATSTVVADKIEELLKRRGFTDFSVDRCKAVEASARAADYDLIITTTPIHDAGGTPVIRTVSFLSGVGIDRDINEIVRRLGWS